MAYREDIALFVRKTEAFPTNLLEQATALQEIFCKIGLNIVDWKMILQASDRDTPLSVDSILKHIRSKCSSDNYDVVVILGGTDGDLVEDYIGANDALNRITNQAKGQSK